MDHAVQVSGARLYRETEINRLYRASKLLEIAPVVGNPAAHIAGELMRIKQPSSVPVLNQSGRGIVTDAPD